MGHISVHALVEGEVVAIEALLRESSKFGLELRTGHGSRVLELTQPLVGKETEITVRHDLFEGALTPVRFGVFGACEPTEEIGGTIVETVSI